MRRLWILNHYAGIQYEGQGGRHHWFAKHLNHHRYETSIFCANTRHGQPGHFIEIDGRQFAELTTPDGIEYIFVTCREYFGNGISRMLNMLDFYRGVKRAMERKTTKEGKPDVILASSVHPLTLVAGEAMARKWDIPCICEVRDLWPESFFYSGALKENGLIGKVLTMGERRIYAHADALIFLKPGDPHYIIEHGWDTDSGGKIDYGKCYYINNGVDLAAFDSLATIKLSSDLEWNNECKTFIYTGTINKTNAVGNLVEAAKLLMKRKDIRILVCGAGVELGNLKRQCDEQHLYNIQFAGFVPKQSIPSILSKAHASILNYTANGYNWTRGNSSNKLFEYLAAGHPVISTVKMGFSPIEEYGCGITLEVSDARHLAEAIEIISDMDKQNYESMCQAARSCAEQYDFARLTEKLEHVIDSVMLG